MFKYENVEGAPSRALGDQIDEDVKQERWERFMEVQQDLADARGQSMIGRTIDVIVDERDEETGEWLARSKADAPEIDGIVRVTGAPDAQEGDILAVEVLQAAGHELSARHS